MLKQRLNKFKSVRFDIKSKFCFQDSIKHCLPSDFDLRQGDGGTKTARFSSKNCFLRQFHNRSESYFGQKSQEHVKTMKNIVFVLETFCFFNEEVFKR